jgi:hypothetical protein
LPDNSALVFVRTPAASFTSDTAGSTTTSNLFADAGADDSARQFLSGKPSDLYIVERATGKVTLLAKAMGFATPSDAASDNTYLPFAKLDTHRNYFPTVSQVAAGGYYWVFFDALRHYGSLGLQRALWGFALDIHPDGSYASDPSHPAFYLPGQEFGTSNNHRAFAALEPCKNNGGVCTSAIDCCAGSVCAFDTGAGTTRLGLPIGTCSAPPATQTCAKRDERCARQADCCDASDYCINGFCAAAVELL